MDLLQNFHDFIGKERLFTAGDRLLLAVSGGVDSVALCELCHLSGLSFVIAHCNFGLRGAESGRDERFVRELADRYHREIRVKTFDTAGYAAGHRLSVQAAARELRYGWFSELIREGIGGYVVTAHQLDDNVETLLMNFFRGTGIAGLRGMLPRQGIVVRPLLFAGRAEILEFVRERGLAWVEDSSNLEDKYTRNFFRHQLIPLVEKAYPAATRNLAAAIGRFRAIELIYREAVERQKKRLLEYRGQDVYISAGKLKQASSAEALVYEITAPYGFSAHQSEAVVGLLDSASGKFICSDTHRILKDRKWLIISPLDSKEAAILPVGEGDSEIFFAQGSLRLEKKVIAAVIDDGSLEKKGGAAVPDEGLRVALLDAAAVGYPLLLRKWKPGDYFYPLGMRKKKKLARFFIDSKVSVVEKDRIWVLESDKRILWVIGYRIDDRCKIGPGTTALLRVEWTPVRNGDG